MEPLATNTKRIYAQRTLSLFLRSCMGSHVEKRASMLALACCREVFIQRYRDEYDDGDAGDDGDDGDIG